MEEKLEDKEVCEWKQTTIFRLSKCISCNGKNEKCSIFNNPNGDEYSSDYQKRIQGINQQISAYNYPRRQHY